LLVPQGISFVLNFPVNNMTTNFTQPLQKADMCTRHGSKPVAIVRLFGLSKGGVV